MTQHHDKLYITTTRGSYKTDVTTNHNKTKLSRAVCIFCVMYWAACQNVFIFVNYWILKLIDQSHVFKQSLLSSRIRYIFKFAVYIIFRHLSFRYPLQAHSGRLRNTVNYSGWDISRDRVHHFEWLSSWKHHVQNYQYKRKQLQSNAFFHWPRPCPTIDTIGSRFKHLKSSSFLQVILNFAWIPLDVAMTNVFHYTRWAPQTRFRSSPLPRIETSYTSPRGILFVRN